MSTHQLNAFLFLISCREKNGTDVSQVKELEGRYRILAAERKFIIEKTDVHDDGLYSCVANGQKKDFNVVGKFTKYIHTYTYTYICNIHICFLYIFQIIAKIAVRVPSNTGVVEGEKLSIVCTVVGTNPQLSWSFGESQVFSIFSMLQR